MESLRKNKNIFPNFVCSYLPRPMISAFSSGCNRSAPRITSRAKGRYHRSTTYLVLGKGSGQLLRRGGAGRGPRWSRFSLGPGGVGTQKLHGSLELDYLFEPVSLCPMQWTHLQVDEREYLVKFTRKASSQTQTQSVSLIVHQPGWITYPYSQLTLAYKHRHTYVQKYVHGR